MAETIKSRHFWGRKRKRKRISVGLYYSITKFGGASAKISTCFEQKKGFCNTKFSEFGGGGGDHFLMKPPKGTSLADFTRFEPLCVEIRSGVLSLGCSTKKGTLQKVTERLYFTYLRGIPHSAKFN